MFIEGVYPQLKNCSRLDMKQSFRFQRFHIFPFTIVLHSVVPTI